MMNVHNVIICGGFVCYYFRASLKTPYEKKQLCTASAVSSPLIVRKHAFDGFSCIYCTYLLFLIQNELLEMHFMVTAAMLP